MYNLTAQLVWDKVHKQSRLNIIAQIFTLTLRDTFNDDNTKHGFVY